MFLLGSMLGLIVRLMVIGLEGKCWGRFADHYDYLVFISLAVSPATSGPLPSGCFGIWSGYS